MTPTRITREALDVLRSWQEPGERLSPEPEGPDANGLYTIPVSPLTLKRLAAVTFPGESVSDVLVRLAAIKN